MNIVTDEWGTPIADGLVTRAEELDAHADWLRDFAVRKSFYLERPEEHPHASEQIRTAVELASFLRRDAAYLRSQRTPVSDNRTQQVPVAGTRHLSAV